jgi:C-terminal processing protease CtpA/Prc
MRQGSWLIVVAILASPAPAAPPPSAPPAAKDRKESRAESRKFAQQLAYLTEQITQHYVRPVSREDLLEAALAGLYQAARKPPPRDLKAQVRQAVSLSGMLRAQASAGGEELSSVDRPPTDPVEKLLARLREQVGAAEALQGQNPVLLSCKALTRLLDPHSGIVTAEEQRRAVGLDNENVGVGLELKDAPAPGPLVIEAVHAGGPAQRVGLRPGDVLVKLDDVPAAKAPPPKLLALRLARPQDEAPRLARPDDPAPQVPELPAVVKVTYLRPGEEQERTATLLRERYRAETVQGVRRRDDNRWDWFADEKARLAHVRLTCLARGTSEELRDVLAGLREQKARGVLLDLRWCPGGYLNEAVEVADLFLGTCVVATIKNRGREDTVYRSTNEGKFRDFALVVLVNGETSGGAELIAAALQDHRRAVVVGQRTLGKASVQTPLALGVEGVGFKLTSGTFMRPAGKNLHRFPDSTAADDWGVVPDEDARLSPQLGKRLKEWWLLQSLRPARSAERLPLDDPRADPQQMLALEALARAAGKKAR